MTAFRRVHGIPPTPSRPDAAVRRWRRAQLVAAGYDELSAHRLASRPGVDLHVLLDEGPVGPPRAGRSGGSGIAGRGRRG